MLPGLTTEERAAIGAHCKFTHAAVLVFPHTLTDLRDDLRASDLAVGEITPSVVVRDRLSRRYGLSCRSLEVGILRAPLKGRDGQPCEIEIFALAAPPGTGLDDIVASERVNGYETHIALEVSGPDRIVLSGLCSTLTLRGRMGSDGGGYNGYENTTVLYFCNADCPSQRHRRLELIAKGQHQQILTAHRRQSEQPAKRLLQLMTGAWTTQALAVAAELKLADHLASNGGATTEQLVRLTGTDHDSLRRLLRYLASLGVVKARGDTFAITELGHLLRTDADHSLHPLALLYGGPFYQSFGQLIHSVRTGRESFRHLFGKGHFDYFAERPERAELFDRAMASSVSMFSRVAEIVDLSAARVVVDIAGGNGELLGQILRATPHLQGVLLERPHAIEAARTTLAKAGCADRCQLIAGDFTSGVPQGGDVYLLSRILHDWDDQQCQTILKRCAEAMPRLAELLIVGRLLPDDDSPSLALAWDIHMMCNVGGRERTTSHYRRMLSKAGFELTAQYELPLDFALLRASRRQPPAAATLTEMTMPDTAAASSYVNPTGEFTRDQRYIATRITADGRDGFPVEPGRYRLVVSRACPWANRSIIVRRLLGLEDALSMGVTGPTHDARSWTFDLDPGGRDPVLGIERLQEAYFARFPGYDRGITVPAIVDTSTGQVVTNDYSQITLDLSTEWRAHHRRGAPDLYPEDHRTEINDVNRVVFTDVNNGVYRCGFAGTQEAYEAAYHRLFDRLDWLSDRLEHQRYLVGDTITEADVRLFTTLVRFDAVYHGHFKCNRCKLTEMPVLWAYARDLFCTPGFGDTIDFDHIKRHYYQVHRDINPTGIVPAGPDLAGWLRPHGRDSLGGRPFGDGTPPPPPPQNETVPRIALRPCA